VQIKNLKDLEAAMKLCAKHGIKTLKVGNIEMSVELPVPNEAPAYAQNSPELAPTSTYTDADYMLWSAGPNPES